MRLAALMRAFTGSTAILETSPFAMLLLLWCLAFAWALRDLFLLLPGHALHEKGLQRQKGVVPLVGSKNKKRFSSC